MSNPTQSIPAILRLRLTKMRRVRGMRAGSCWIWTPARGKASCSKLTERPEAYPTGSGRSKPRKAAASEGLVGANSPRLRGAGRRSCFGVQSFLALEDEILRLGRARRRDRRVRTGWGPSGVGGGWGELRAGRGIVDRERRGHRRRGGGGGRPPARAASTADGRAPRARRRYASAPPLAAAARSAPP